MVNMEKCYASFISSDIKYKLLMNKSKSADVLEMLIYPEFIFSFSIIWSIQRSRLINASTLRTQEQFSSGILKLIWLFCWFVHFSAINIDQKIENP